MEEMQATQEEATKKEAELNAVIEGFNSILPVVEYDINGKIIDVNDVYISIHKVQKSHVIGKQHKADLFMNEVEQAKSLKPDKTNEKRHKKIKRSEKCKCQSYKP